MHRIFIRGKRREYVIADSALICVQVHVWSFWLDADEHHPGFALRTRGSLKCNRRWNGGRRALRLAHNASPHSRTRPSGARARPRWITVGAEVCDPSIAADGYGSCAKQKEAPKAGSGRGRNLAGPRLLPGIGLGDRGASDLLSGAAVCSLKSQAVLFEERISWQ